MLQRCVLSLAILCLGIPHVLRADEASDKFVGTWKTKSKFAGYDQLLTIGNDGGRWSVKGTFQKGGADVGTFIGENVKFADGQLTYLSKHIKKPDESWGNDDVTLHMDGDTVIMSFPITSGGKIERAFERIKGQQKPPANGPPKSDDRFSGTWKGRIDTHDEIWTVKKTEGGWSINGKFRRNGAETGSFIGTDITESDGTLSFTRKFIKKPVNTEWRDQVSIVVKPEGDNLSYTWSLARQKGTRALEKYTEGEKPAEDDLGKFRGYWTADVATGFRVVMHITMKNDKIEVTANYYKNGRLAGAFVGVDAALKDGFLTFSQKFTPKPVSSWSDGKLHTLEIISDNVLKFSWKNGGTENFARVKK